MAEALDHVLVIENGSTDGTRAWLATLDEPRLAVIASIGLTVTGAATRPTKAVKTTSDMTRGFNSAR